MEGIESQDLGLRFVESAESIRLRSLAFRSLEFLLVD